MKTESIFALLILAVLGYFGYDYLKKQNSGGISLAGQISAAVGNPSVVETESSQLGWQIPYAQPTFMPSKDYIGNMPQDPIIN